IETRAPPAGLTLPTPGAENPLAKPADSPGGVTIPPAAGGGIEKSTEPSRPLGAGAGADDGAPGVNENNLTGRQEPAVSLEWIGPPAAKVGLPAEYTIAVRNVCNIAVQQVLVRVR